MPKKISFSKIEIENLTLAWFAITLAFAIAMSEGKIFEISFLIKFAISAITVGLGFVAHEMAHKILAQKHKCFAEFRANYIMLILAVVMSFTGVIFAAPGAVIISGNITRKIHGKIAAAGPAMNIILAVLFLGLYFISEGLLKQVGMYGMTINAWLAMFNILPFPMFDGIKIMQWDKIIYSVMIAVSVILLFLTGII